MVTTRLVAPTPADAVKVASWSESAETAARWCSQPEHPFPLQTITSWWADPDVSPWLLTSTDDGAALAYGELWVDHEQDEVELARLIVDHRRRRTGLGRRLVHELLAVVERTGVSMCVLRVAPDNAAVAGLYLACGFTLLDPERTAEFNQGQPRPYRWFERTGFHSRSD